MQSSLRLRSLLLFFSVWLLSPKAAFAQKQMDAVLVIKQLEQAIPSLMDSAQIPNLSVAFIDEGKLLWSKSYGVTSKQTGEGVSEQTIFRAGSLGKPLFGYAVLKLCHQGKLALDTPLTRYVPLAYLEKEFVHGKIKDKRFHQITARMVLTHRSGFPNWRLPADSLSIHFTPGERYSYSGEGFLYLQKVIEYLTKQPIEEFMQQTVFKPLGMLSSSYIIPDTLGHAKAYGAEGKPVAYPLQESANVAHSLNTNAKDYATFLVALMNDNDLQGNIFSQMLANRQATDICSPGMISWGLGIGIQHTSSGDAFLQWGKSIDASAYVFGFKESRRALIYLTNIANRGLSIGESLVKISLDHQDAVLSCFGVKPYKYTTSKSK